MVLVVPVYEVEQEGVFYNTAFVPDEIIDRFCLLSPVEHHRERLGKLERLGVGQFSLYLMHDNPFGTIDAYAKHVIGA